MYKLIIKYCIGDNVRMVVIDNLFIGISSAQL